MWLKQIDRTAESGVYDLGFLFKSGKIYIMDNHLAAGWCWLNELDPQKNYNFFHIDRHYDLLNNESAQYLRTLKLDQNPTLDDYMKMSVSSGSPAGNWQLFRFDNYIMNLFYVLPNFFGKKVFATHNDGTVPADFDIDYKPQIISLQKELAYQIECSPDAQWILNLDLDYFFANKNGTEYLQLLSDEYIDALCDQIILALDSIAVITIAMSPYFCNGWSNARRILERITGNLNITIAFPEDYQPD